MVRAFRGHSRTLHMLLKFWRSVTLFAPTNAYGHYRVKAYTYAIPERNGNAYQLDLIKGAGW
jgi:hypothetical protein